MRSRFTRRIWALFVATSLLPFAGATAQTYSVVEFAPLSYPDIAPTATAISANGSITGYIGSSAIVSDGVTITYLPTIGLRSYGYGINGTGQVTGDFTLTMSVAHAFLFSGGFMTDLETLPGSGNRSVGYAINDSGQITG